MIKRIWSSELGRGAIILLVMINIYNVLNFAFHFSMARLLGPADYGILAVLMSLVYVFGAPSEAIQSVVTKYTSRFNIKDEKSKIKFLITYLLKSGFKIGGVIFVLLEIFSIWFSGIVKVNYGLIFLTNVLIFTAFFLPISRGVLQGRKKLFLLGTSMILESGLKLFLAIAFVIIGFQELGAIGGVLVSSFIVFIISLYFSNDIFSSKGKSVDLKNLKFESIAYFVSMFVVLIMFSLDIFLARRFFSEDLAGKYSVLSMLGKMIYFGTLGVSKAMFPLTSEKHEKNESSGGIFKKSIFLIGGLCLIGILIYYLFPELIVKILYGNQYLEIAPYLVYSAIALSFLSLSNLVFNYCLSTNRLRRIWFLLCFPILEIILFMFFHETIFQYILAFMCSNIIMFIGSFFVIKR